MLSISQSPLSPKEVMEVTQWLTSPTAQLFVRTLESKMVTLQAKAANMLEESITYPEQRVSVDELVDQMRMVHNCLSVLKLAKEKTGDLGLTSIIVEHVRAYNHATDTNPASHSRRRNADPNRPA